MYPNDRFTTSEGTKKGIRKIHKSFVALADIR